MKRKAVAKTIGAVVLAAIFSLAACKGENPEQEADTDTEVVGDSINPTGSDGLGREIDTVEQIERAQQDTVVAKP